MFFQSSLNIISDANIISAVFLALQYIQIMHQFSIQLSPDVWGYLFKPLRLPSAQNRDPDHCHKADSINYQPTPVHRDYGRMWEYSITTGSAGKRRCSFGRSRCGGSWPCIFYRGGRLGRRPLGGADSCPACRRHPDNRKPKFRDI